MMETVSTSETSENFYQTTRQNIPSSYLLPWEPEMSPMFVMLNHLITGVWCKPTIVQLQVGKMNRQINYDLHANNSSLT
jgi:hypothetical protein